MALATAILQLVTVDAKLVARDRVLASMSGLSIAIALAMRFLLPTATRSLEANLGFDLVPYYPLVTSFVVMSIGAPLIGLVLGFVLVEAREDNTVKALLVTPFSLRSYLWYRALTPIVLGFLLTPLTAIVIGVGVPPLRALIPFSVVASISAGIAALFIPTFSDNKVQAFAMMKIFGALNWIPFAAYFVREPWQYIAGVFPPYWVFKGYWTATVGGSGWMIHFAIGAVTMWLALWWLVGRFHMVAKR